MEDLSSILSGEPSQPAPEQQQPVQAEVQQPVEQEHEDTGEENTASPAVPQKDDNLEKARKGLEAAAKAERERRQAAEARAEAAERRARELEERQLRQQPQRQPEQEEDPKPLRANFASEDEWLDARDAWRDRQREAAQAVEKAQKEARDLYTKTESIYAQAQALEGFDRATFDRLPLTKPMVEALVESDSAPKLMHYMAANPAEVSRIAGLSATKQYQELARIEDKLAATPAAAEEDEGDDKPPKAKPQLPNTLTQARNAKGQFEPAYSGPTPLNSILSK